MVFSPSVIAPDFEKDPRSSLVFLTVFARGRNIALEGGGVRERERESVCVSE